MSKQNQSGSKSGPYVTKVVTPTKGVVKGGQIPTSRNPPSPPKKGGGK